MDEAQPFRLLKHYGDPKISLRMTKKSYPRHLPSSRFPFPRFSHAKKPPAQGFASGLWLLVWKCRRTRGGLLQLAFSFFVLVYFLRRHSGLLPRAPTVSRVPGGALLCTVLFSKGSGRPVMISRAFGYRFFPSDRYMTENRRSGRKTAKIFSIPFYFFFYDFFCFFNRLQVRFFYGGQILREETTVFDVCFFQCLPMTHFTGIFQHRLSGRCENAI